MTKIKKFLILNSVLIIVLVLLSSAPAISFAYNVGDPLVPQVCTSVSPPVPGQAPHTYCGWNDFMALVNNIITFILRDMVIPIAAIMSAYAGFLMVGSAGSSESRTKAKKICTNAVIGLIIALVAWLVISLILVILGYKGGWIGLII